MFLMIYSTVGIKQKQQSKFLPEVLQPVLEQQIFHKVWYSQVGMVHCTYWGVTGYTFH